MQPIRRKQFLINKPFQFRFSVYVCSWLVAMCFIYPMVVFNLFEYFLRYASLDPTGPDLASLYRTRSEVLWLLVFTQIAFLGLTFLNSLFLSHRIAGPIYKLRLYMAKAATGTLTQPLSFRKKDHFNELADDFNTMIQALRTNSAGAEAITASLVHIERALPHAGPEGRKELELAMVTLRSAGATKGKN